jgi:15-cis-phytoene synthase
VARDTSFYYSFLVLPPAERSAVVAVWDFCRAVDDAVDEVTDNAQAAIEVRKWREELERVFGAAEPLTPQGAGLKPFVSRFALPREPFDELVNGVEMDLNHPQYATFDELLLYCRRVASGVGLICVEIFGCRHGEARDYAINLGIALQLTNIVRDVAGDLARGRVYLPQEDLARFGCTVEMLRAGVVTEPVRRLLTFECQRAREYYVRAARAMPPAATRRLVAAEIMGGIYFEILQRIERRQYDVFSEVIRVPRPARARIALSIFMKNRLWAMGFRLWPAARA